MDFALLTLPLKNTFKNWITMEIGIYFYLIMLGIPTSLVLFIVF